MHSRQGENLAVATCIIEATQKNSGCLERCGTCKVTCRSIYKHSAAAAARIDAVYPAYVVGILRVYALPSSSYSAPTSAPSLPSSQYSSSFRQRYLWPIPLQRDGGRFRDGAATDVHEANKGSHVRCHAPYPITDVSKLNEETVPVDYWQLFIRAAHSPRFNGTDHEMQ